MYLLLLVNMETTTKKTSVVEKHFDDPDKQFTHSTVRRLILHTILLLKKPTYIPINQRLGGRVFNNN